MIAKRILLLAAVALFAAAAGCGSHRSCCRHDEFKPPCEPECHSFDPCRQ
jgi:hypothetical protein